MRSLLLATWLAATAVTAGPKLESLYDSSDPALQWPPEGTSFEGDDVKAWPGHGRRFGEGWPRAKVAALEEVPGQREFFAEHVAARRPVVIGGLVERMSGAGSRSFGIDMRAEALKNSGRAAVTPVEVITTGARGKKRTTTLRDALSELSKDGKSRAERSAGYMQGTVGRAIKTRLGIPPPLWCSAVILGNRTMRGTRHSFYGAGESAGQRMRQPDFHQLHCQVEGRREFLLLNGTADFPTWDDLELPGNEDGKIGPLVNFQKVDYKLSPDVKDIRRFSIARLEPGQCLFVPSGWIHQINVLDGDHSFEVRWEQLENEADLACDPKMDATTWTLGDLAWPADGVPTKPKEKTADLARHALELLVHVIEGYVLAESPKMDDAFMKRLAADKEMTGNLPQWNSECEEIAAEIFNLLDLNKDGALNDVDLRSAEFGLDDDAVTKLASGVFQRWQDFAELIFDMRVDQAVERGGATGVTDGITAEAMAETAQLIAQLEQLEMAEEAEYRREKREPLKEAGGERQSRDEL